MTDVTLGVSGHWLDPRAGAGGTVTLTYSFFLDGTHGSMDKGKGEVEREKEFTSRESSNINNLDCIVLY